MLKPTPLPKMTPAAMPKLHQSPVQHVGVLPQVSGASVNPLAKEARMSRQLDTLNAPMNIRQEDSAAMTKRIADTLLGRLQKRDK